MHDFIHSPNCSYHNSEELYSEVEAEVYYRFWQYLEELAIKEEVTSRSEKLKLKNNIKTDDIAAEYRADFFKDIP